MVYTVRLVVAQRMQDTLSCVSLLVRSGTPSCMAGAGQLHQCALYPTHIGFLWLQTPREHKHFKTHMVSKFLGCQSETPPHCIKYVFPRQREWALHIRHHLLCPRDHLAHSQWTGLFSPRVKVSWPIEPMWTVAQTTHNS